jgi:predicted nuclease of predicted toxin-antitoxin system
MTWKRLPGGTKSQEAGFNTFRKKARFLVDESLGHAVARVLRDLSWNTVFGPDVGLARHADEDVFAYAWREHRILLTHDRGFLDDRRFPPHRNPGVVVLPGGSGPARGLVEGLRAVLSIIAPYRKAFRRFKIEITEDGTWNTTNMTRVDDVVRRWRIRPSRGPHVDEWEAEPGPENAMANTRLKPSKARRAKNLKRASSKRLRG